PPGDSRFLVPSVRKGPGEDLGRALAGRRSIVIPLACAGRGDGTESGGAGFDTQAAEEIAARAHDGRDELGAGWEDARDCGLSRARCADARIALRLRHSQLGVGWHQFGRHSVERGSDSDPRQGKEGTLRAVWRQRESRAVAVSAGTAEAAGRDTQKYECAVGEFARRPADYAQC